MLEIIGDFERAVSLISGLKQKLLDQPDPAAKYLAQVLEELSKTCTAIDSEITNYLSIWFDEKNIEGILSNRRILIGLEGGITRIRMAEARGHCSKIKSIYNRYLKRWFNSVFDPYEYDQMERLFGELTTGDTNIIESLDQLATWLEDRASDILDKIRLKNYDGANADIEADRTSIKKNRLTLSSAMVQLYCLHADFIGLSGAL